MKSLTVWCNQGLNSEQAGWMRKATEAHHLIVAEPGQSIEQTTEELNRAEVAFGQPPLSAVLASTSLRWVQVSSAGYGNYDKAHARPVFKTRGLRLTKSSAVYAEPCAQHVLSAILAQSRRLPEAFANQLGPKLWPHAELRRKSVLLRDQSIVIAGFGSIATRLVEMLRPFTTRIVGVRRTPTGDEGIPMLRQDDPALGDALGAADHVINVLPGVAGTEHFFGPTRLSQIQPGAVFYNVGRGTTVDTEALTRQLQSGALAAAWLDVTDPEPLPSEHPLWGIENCFITPHSAGGHHNEGDRLVQHFTRNLARFERGEALEDRAL